MTYVLILLALIVGYFLGIGVLLCRAAKSEAYERRVLKAIHDLIPSFRT